MSGYSVEDALQQCEDIITIIEEDLDDNAWEKGRDFFESVKQSVTDMSETIERTGHVTDKQLSALANWEAGVLAWIRDD